MEFVQFHPTALDTPENPLALISEAVRGEGAMLVNSRGVRFMRGRAPTRRARAARRRRARDLSRAARWAPSLSTRASSARGSSKRFPGIFALCQARGIDPRKDLIPVTPAAHYMMGGVVTDLRGRSSVAATVRGRRGGAHRRARRESARVELAARGARVRRARRARSVGESAPHRASAEEDVEGAAADGSRRRAGGRRRHSHRDVGLRRHRAHGARSARQRSSDSTRSARGCRPAPPRSEHAADGATRRRGGAPAKESRGGHYRADYPRAKTSWRGRHIEL